MSEKRFVVQEDANTDKIILLIDYNRMKMYSFLAEEREAVNKICNYLNWFDECTHNYAVMLKEIEESNCEKSKEIAKLKKLEKENEQLKQELQGMEELLQSYRKTIKHDAELLADATRNGYLPPLNDSVSNDGWICGCCKHFHSGVRDRCDKDNNWVLKDGSCQDFER